MKEFQIKFVNRQKILLIIIIALTIMITFIVALYYKLIFKNIEIIVTVISTLFGFYKVVKEKSLKFSKIISKVKAILTNRQVSFSINADYYGSQLDGNVFYKLKQDICELNGQNQVIENKAESFKIRKNGISIDLKLNFEDSPELYGEEYGHINLYIPEYHAPYNESIDILRKDILETMSDIEKKYTLQNQLYDVEIKFSEKNNPFISLYTKNYGKSLINFECILNEGKQETVTVSKSKLEFKSKNILKVSRLLIDYLAL